MAAEAVEEKEATQKTKPARAAAKKPMSEEVKWLIGGLAVTGPASGLVYRDAIESWVYDNRIWLLGIAVLLIGSCVLAMTRAYRRARGPARGERAHVVSAFAFEGLQERTSQGPLGAVEVPVEGEVASPAVPGEVPAAFQNDEAPKLVAALKLDYAAGKARTLSRGRVDLGEEWVIELPLGGVYGDVAGKTERVISWLDVDPTRVTLRPRPNSRHVVITVLDQPVYSRVPALPDPVEAARRGVLSVGYDMYGHLVEIISPIGDTHILIAGSSGGGKTEEIKWLVYFALVNGWDIVLVDAKGDGDLAYAEKACLIYEEVPDHERMMEIIAFVEKRHEGRAAENSASVRAGNGKAKHRPLLFIIDEVSTYTDEADSRKEATAFEAKMKTASRKFRSSKILVVLSTQNPKSEVINTSIRANHRVRLAFGCAETRQSDVILGSGAARSGHDASKLPAIDGAAILQVKDKNREMRGFFITDDDLNEAIDARVEEVEETEPEHVRLIREAYAGETFLSTVEFASRLRQLGVEIDGEGDDTATGKAVAAWLSRVLGRSVPTAQEDRVRGRYLAAILAP